MELTAKRRLKDSMIRTPFQESNFQFPPKQNINRLIKPAKSTNLSVQVSQKTSADNSFSLSPIRTGVPLTFVTPSHVNISLALQKTIKSRSNSKTSKKTPKSSFFARNQVWKKETNTKISKLKLEKDKFEMSQCTFAPNLKKIADRSTLSSRRSSGFRGYCVKKDLENEQGAGIRSGFETRTFDETAQDEIEKSFVRVNMALDCISKQILETIAADGENLN